MDGDESGQNAAYRIAEKLFPFINEKNRIYFSTLPDGQDPDDFLKKKGKLNFLELLKQKQIIQLFIWNYNLSKVNLNSPYDISNFEKEIKKLTYSMMMQL